MTATPTAPPTREDALRGLADTITALRTLLPDEQDIAADAAVDALTDAGYQWDSPDVLGDPVSDAAQTALQIAYLLAPKLMPELKPADGVTCTVSSWQGESHQPYGPGGYNRCSKPADDGHTRHRDGFNQVFIRTGKGVRVLARLAAGEPE